MPSQTMLRDATLGVTSQPVDLVNLTGAASVPNVVAIPNSAYVSSSASIQLQGSNDDVGNPPSWTNIGSSQGLNGTGLAAVLVLNGGATPYQRVRATLIGNSSFTPSPKQTITLEVSS